MPFPRIFTQCKTQTASSRIWSRVADSISYDENHNAKRVFLDNHRIPYQILSGVISDWELAPMQAVLTLTLCITSSTGAVEYSDCTSA